MKTPKCEYAWTDFQGEHHCGQWASFMVSAEDDDPLDELVDSVASCRNHVGSTVRDSWGGFARVASL